jgi:ribonuclease HI
MKGRAITLRCDGASRGNPGPAGAGALIEAEGTSDRIEISEFLGETTNNVAEYSALLLGLRKAEALSPSSLTVYSDSELLVRQIRGEYRVKSPLLRPLYQEACRRLRRFPAARILHVGREENGEADRLANRAIDAHFQKV